MPDPPRRPPVVPGIPGAALPPPGRHQPPPLHARKSGDTHVGLPAPPADSSAPGAPGSDFTTTIESPKAEPTREPYTRKDSPPPVSVPTSAAEREAARLRAELQDALQERDELRRRQVEVEVEQSPLSVARKALLRRLTPWLGAAVLSAAGTGVGYLKGQAKGYLDAFERVSKLEGAFRVERDRRARLDGEAAAALANVNADLDTAFAKNREQDAKLGKLDALLKEAPVVVRPK